MKKQSVQRIERIALQKMRARLAADCGLSIDELRDAVRFPSADCGGAYAVNFPKGVGEPAG